VNGPTVSVIIIVFNGRAFLREAIDSVLAQTFDDYELLIVDDGSTDDTLAIAEEAARERPERIAVLRHPGGVNRGMSATRNLGVSHAKGEFVAFLDADDVWLPHKLAEQVDLMRHNPSAGLVYGRALIWRSWQTGSEADDFYYDLGVEPGRLYEPPRLFLRQLHNVDQTPTTSGTLLRRSLIEAVGGFEPVFQAMFEDQVFFAKALLTASAYVSDATWFRYRQHDGSASAQSAAAGADERARIRYLEWLTRHLRDQSARTTELQAVRSTLRAARSDHFRRRLRRALRGHRRS
jgi:glycosyltransferase involved in cell wall biosynthesis